MSKIAQLIQQKKSNKSELVASTVRISTETHSFIEELAEHLGLSKQETLIALIDEGVAVTKGLLQLDEPDDSSTDCTFHLLNTNKRHSVEDGKIMLEKNMAAAFYAPWKYCINKIKEDDVVFLYENGVGIIAYGRATGETLVRDYDGDAGEFHYQHLNNFKILKRPLSAAEIKKILRGSIVFLKVMTSISDGYKLLEAVEGGVSPQGDCISP